MCKHACLTLVLPRRAVYYILPVKSGKVNFASLNLPAGNFEV